MTEQPPQTLVLIQDTQVSQVPQARQVTKVGQETKATRDIQVSQVPQACQVGEVRHVTTTHSSNTIGKKGTVKYKYISIHYNNYI